MELRIAIVECQICRFTAHRMNIALVSLFNKRSAIQTKNALFFDEIYLHS